MFFLFSSSTIIYSTHVTCFFVVVCFLHLQFFTSTIHVTHVSTLTLHFAIVFVFLCAKAASNWIPNSSENRNNPQTISQPQSLHERYYLPLAMVWWWRRRWYLTNWFPSLLWIRGFVFVFVVVFCVWWIFVAALERNESWRWGDIGIRKITESTVDVHVHITATIFRYTFE